MRNYPCPIGKILGVNYWTDCPEFKSEEELIHHLDWEHSGGVVSRTLARIVAESKPAKYRIGKLVKGFEHTEILEGRR